MKCPDCKSKIYRDPLGSNGDFYIQCENCGYLHTRRNLDGEMQDYYIKHAYGFFKISGAWGVTGSLKSEEEFNNQLLLCINDNRLISMWLSSYIDGKIIKKEVFNRKKYIRKQKLQKIIYS